MRECFADLTVEGWHVLFFLKTFAVRRVCDNKAVFLAVAQLRDRALLEMDQMIDLSKSCVLHSRLDGARINIIALDIHLNIPSDLILRLTGSIVPDFFRDNVCPVLGREGTVHARSDIRTDHGCLRSGRFRCRRTDRQECGPISMGSA